MGGCGLLRRSCNHINTQTHHSVSSAGTGLHCSTLSTGTSRNHAAIVASTGWMGNVEVGHPCRMLARVRLYVILRSRGTAGCSHKALKFTVYFCPGAGTIRLLAKHLPHPTTTTILKQMESEGKVEQRFSRVPRIQSSAKNMLTRWFHTFFK